MKKSKTKEKKAENLLDDKIEGTGTPSNIFVNLYPVILIVLIGALCYSNTFNSPFIFDDEPNIVEDEGIHLDNFSSAELDMLKETIMKKSLNMRPIARISFALNYYFGGLNTFGYHLVNIFIHLMCAILVYLFLNITLNLPSLQKRYGKQSQDVALLCSLFFVAHPIQTQAVTYIVQRMTSLGTMFYLLSLLAYVKGEIASDRKRILFFIVSALSALLAFGTKENTLTLPIFILLYEFLFIRKLDFKRIKRKFGPLFILFILLTIIWVIYTQRISWIQKEYNRLDFTMTQRIFTEFRVIIFYLSLLIAPLPSRLNLDHYFSLSYSLFNPPTTLFCFAMIVGLIVISIRLARKHSLISFALIWFWGNLALESSFLPIDLIFEHRLYLSSIGFFILVSIFLINVVKKVKTQDHIKSGMNVGLLLVLIVPLSILSYQRNKTWQDELVLWKDTVGKSPNMARPRSCLAETYKNRGNLAEAITQYQRILEIYPGYIGAHLSLGAIYFEQDKPEAAITEFMEEIKCHPENPKAYYNLGYIYTSQGRSEEGSAQYQRAFELDPTLKDDYESYLQQNNPEQTITQLLEETKRHPNSADTYNKLGDVYLSQERFSEAISSYKRVLEIDSNNIEARNNLGCAYSSQGSYEKAEKAFQQVIRLDSRHPKAYYNLGLVYSRQKLYQKAIDSFTQDLMLDAEDYNTLYELGRVYASQGLYEKAISEYKKAIALAPEDAKIYNALGLAFVRNKMYREAEETFLKILIIDGDSFSTREQLGNVYYLWGMKKKAIDEWKKALIIDPHNKALQKNLEILVQQLK